MQLSSAQLKAFDEEGYLFLPDCFSDEEVAALRRDAEAIYGSGREGVWREKCRAPLTAFAPHTYNEGFRLLGAHPRLIEPVEQLFGEKLYMHQFKVNAKAAFDGDVWQWHQDYGTWARDDGMPEPRAMNISVFLDEVMPINGPLMFIPRSHKHGVLPAGHDEATTSYPLWTLNHETITRLVDAAGIVAPTGKPGAVLMFHGNLVHASTANITPYPRKIVYLTLCAVSNHIRKPTRPDWIAHRDLRRSSRSTTTRCWNTRALVAWPRSRSEQMPLERMVLQIGMGTDIRGADYTKAAVRALRDALWHNSLSVANALGQPTDAMQVEVTIGVPRPDLVDKEQVLAVLPHGTGTVNVVEGGLEISNDEGTNKTVVANAAAVVRLDLPERRR